MPNPGVWSLHSAPSDHFNYTCSHKAAPPNRCEARASAGPKAGEITTETLMSHTLAGTRDRSRTSGGCGGGGSTAPEKPNDQTQQHHFIVTRAHTHLSLGRSAADNDEANKAKTIFSPGMEKRIAPLVPRVCSDPCVCLGACRALHMPSGAAHCICNKSSPASRSQCFKETDATSAPLCVTG